LQALPDERFMDYSELSLKVSMANRIEPFLAINFEPLFQRKITYSVSISVDSFPLLT
jgi:hypothetical protein